LGRDVYDEHREKNENGVSAYADDVFRVDVACDEHDIMLSFSFFFCLAPKA
jgi:hypothetical protein